VDSARPPALPARRHRRGDRRHARLHASRSGRHRSRRRALRDPSRGVHLGLGAASGEPCRSTNTRPPNSPTLLKPAGARQPWPDDIGTGLDGKNSKVPLVKVRPAERSRDTSCSGWRPQVWRTLRRSWRLGGCRIAGSGNSARTTRRRFRALRSSPRFAATVPEQWGSTRLSAVRRPGRRGAIHGANWPTRMRNLGTRKRFFVTNHA
jgi:hypothetical protein